MLALTILDPDLLPTAGRRWDWTTLGLLVALLIFAVASFGAVEAWSQLVVIALAAAMAFCLALRILLDREFRPASTWLYWPLLLFVLLVAVQLLPLPAGVVAALSPSTVATKQELLESDPLTRTTLSFYPRATAEYFRLVLVGATVFAAVASTIRNSRQVRNLLLVIFAIGCAEAALAIAQIATATDKIYWAVPSGHRVITSGTFVNYSHFCQFMNLSLGAGIALFLIELHQEHRRDVRGATWRNSLAQLNWEKYGPLLAGIGLCAISVLTSMSRNGAISLFIAAAVIGAALYRRGSLSWRGWMLGAIPLAVLATLLVVGFDVVYERLATLTDTRAYESRWEMTAATLRAWSHFPIWGTGLGTHEFVFPMFDTAVTPILAAHADNDYAQLLEEMGLAGAATVAVFLIGVAAVAIKLAVRGKTASSTAVYGIAFALIAVAIHSASDFGQRVPANFSLTATLCGLLVAISRIEVRASRKQRAELPATSARAATYRFASAAAALIGVAIVSGWSIRGAYAAFLGERWWGAALAVESRIQRAPEQATDDDYRDLLYAANEAFKSDPDNVNYGYWLNSYRWESISRTIDPDTGQVILHPDELPHVAQIANELAAVRQICPTFGPPYALEGQLRLLVLGDQRGAGLIRKGVRLARYDAPTCLAAGELAAREGRLDEAKPLLERAVELQPAYFREVVDIYLLEAKRPEMARQLAGEDYQRLEELARACLAIPDYAHLAAELREAATSSLRRHAATPDATPQELVSLARIENAEGQHESAIDLFQRALRQDYRQVEWRLELARLLAAAGRIDEAIHEVRVCLRLRPHDTQAVRLMDELLAKKNAKRE
ncbi:MAG TPA: O-antigen ligase family protein, partial [Lacipirellulaceae bacterium]|jgi:O-antigen ligase|nr:O-antigen ligase family protein [Lacipirellulaceae bacterium]